jgi:hypothetical protein
MKRVEEEEEDVLLINEKEEKENHFNLIPLELKKYILKSFLYYDLEYIKLVSKEWYNLINNNDIDWYEISKNLLTGWSAIQLLKILKFEDYINEMYNNVSLAEDYNTMTKEFKSFIGRIILNETNFTEIFKNKTNQEVLNKNREYLLRFLGRYIVSNVYNKLSFKNFHYRDIYCYLGDFHIYNILLNDKNSKSLVINCSSVEIDDNGDITHTDISKMILNENHFWSKSKNENCYCSTTRFIHSLYPDFSADLIIDIMMERRSKWKNQKEADEYYGMTKEEIKLKWENSGREAAEKGTEMHQRIEDYYIFTDERKYLLKYEYTKEFDELFLNYEKECVEGKLIPYRSEWVIFNEELQICGSVDMLYEYQEKTEEEKKDGKKRLVLVDWKRSKGITMFSTEGGNKECTKTTGNSNGMLYTIQLCLYKYMLEQKYNVIIDKMYLVVLHPNQEKYNRIEIVWDTNTQKLINGIIEYRKEYLNNKLNK